jgi:preprotein translocase subunit SecA
MALLERALRMGEGKKFKEFEKRVGRIADFEPEMELLEDHELKDQAMALRERIKGGETDIDEALHEASHSLVRPPSARSASATSTSS